jgi:hypothetical protein
MAKRCKTMTVDEYAEILLKGHLEFVGDGYYENRVGQVGYRAIYKYARGYYWYRVSAAEVPIAPDEVAQAITHHGREVLRENPYLNRKGVQGFEATVRAGEHCFMLNAAPDPPRF